MAQQPWTPVLPRPHAGDLVAGLSVALILIPQSLAYAVLAGMPPVTGLVVGAVATIAAAPFASSPHLQTGPVAITALLTFGALSGLAEPGSAGYVTLAAMLAVMVGLVRLTIGVSRAGVLAYLMSQPVLAGFVPAAALVIAISQLPAMVGVSVTARGPVGVLPAVLRVSAWDTHTVGIAAATLATLLLTRRLHRLFPAVLAAVGVGYGLATATGFGGPSLGGVAASLPTLHTDWPIGMLGELLLPALVIAIVGFAEPAAIARTYARRTRQRWDPDREFVSQGIANIAAGAAGGFPVGGSFSRTAVAEAAGSRTPWSGAISGFLVLVSLPFVGAVDRLPSAVLAAVILGSVLRLLDLSEIAELRELSPRQFVVSVVTFVLTIALAPSIQLAVITGVVVSVGLHLRRELAIHTPSELRGDTLHLRPAGVLYFGSAHRLEDEVVQLLSEHPDVAHVVLHMDRLGRVDVSGALALREIAAQLEEIEVTLTIEDLNHASEEVMGRMLAG